MSCNRRSLEAMGDDALDMRRRLHSVAASARRESSRLALPQLQIDRRDPSHGFVLHMPYRVAQQRILRSAHHLPGEGVPPLIFTGYST